MNLNHQHMIIALLSLIAIFLFTLVMVFAPYMFAYLIIILTVVFGVLGWKSAGNPKDPQDK